MTENSTKALAIWFAQLLDRKGGRNIQVLDLRTFSSVTDFFVIATANSSKHIETLVDAPLQELKKQDRPSNGIEGQGSSWVIADFSDVVIHVFDEETRSYYDLEGLWKNAPRLGWTPTPVAAIALTTALSAAI